MKVTHLTRSRLFAITSLALLLMPPAPLRASPQARRPRAQSAASAARAPVRIAVLPFRDSLAHRSAGNAEPSLLGYGIADSLTNALKSVAGFSVIDSEVVLRTADRLAGA